jgi:hypothetical protein
MKYSFPEPVIEEKQDFSGPVEELISTRSQGQHKI